jgi:hypothetical protein
MIFVCRLAKKLMMADAVFSNLYRSGKDSHINEEFCANTCFKCIYLEERLQATLSELSSLQLAIKLLYTESNTIHTESEVRPHSVPRWRMVWQFRVQTLQLLSLIKK